MSYILDALRRAEADRERERGQVPGLHSLPPPGSQAARAANPHRWLPWAAAGLLLLLAGVGAGSWWASGQNEATATVSPASPQPAPAPRLATPPRTEPATAAVTLPTAIAPTVAPASVPLRRPAASASPDPPPAAPPGAVPAAPAPEARLPRLAELPESSRRELPKLAISGSVYSDDPASRFIIVNGEVAREGAKLGIDLVLEEIRPRELVLRFRGQRYRQPV